MCQNVALAVAVCCCSCSYQGKAKMSPIVATFVRSDLRLERHLWIVHRSVQFQCTIHAILIYAGWTCLGGRVRELSAISAECRVHTPRRCRLCSDSGTSLPTRSLRSDAPPRLTAHCWLARSDATPPCVTSSTLRPSTRGRGWRAPTSWPPSRRSSARQRLTRPKGRPVEPGHAAVLLAAAVEKAENSPERTRALLVRARRPGAELIFARWVAALAGGAAIISAVCVRGEI